MSVNYLPYRTSSVISNTKSKLIQPVMTSAEDIPLLATDDVHYTNPGEITEKDLLDPTPEKVTEEQERIGITEGTNYGPDHFYNRSSPTSQDTDDITEPVQELDHDAQSEPILKTDNTSDQENLLDPNASDHEVPSGVVNYYNEAALTAKKRNKLPDDVFGLPKTRQYPLHDRKHVRQAILMFRHCKNPRDQQILANNIKKALKRFNMNVHVSEKNPLYQYMPHTVSESTVYNLKDVARNALIDRDTNKDRAQYNSVFMNARFYCDQFDMIKAILSENNQMDFVEQCYPNLVTHNFFVRMQCSLGHLGAIPDLYQELGIRYPLSTDFGSPIGLFDKQLDQTSFILDSYYDNSYNWFKIDLMHDIDHIIYCVQLYAVLGMILLNPTFTVSMLHDEHYAILHNWLDRVTYHYDLMQLQEPDSKEYYAEAQYLHDLLWNYLDNPYSEEVKGYMMCNFISSMASVRTNSDERLTRDPNLYTKADMTSYLVKALNMDDSIWLLPDQLEYPVLDRYSVRFAMDMIQRVCTEFEDHVDEYVQNLNRKYHELGCTFQISPDHPYAKYAEKNMIHLTTILSEGETAVEDHGTSVSGNPNDTDVPWYKRYDVSGYLYRDGLENKERGPNDTKPVKSTDLMHFDSFL